MTDRDERFAQIRSLSDQARAGLRDRLPDMDRIANHGPRDDGSDLLLIRMVFLAAAGDIHFGLAEAGED